MLHCVSCAGRKACSRVPCGPCRTSGRGSVATQAAADTDFELREVPRPRFVPPIIGDTIPFLTDWENYFEERTQELGPVFQTNLLGVPVVR
jgi:hypothetical protein